MAVCCKKSQWINSILVWENVVLVFFTFASLGGPPIALLTNCHRIIGVYWCAILESSIFNDCIHSLIKKTPKTHANGGGFFYIHARCAWSYILRSHREQWMCICMGKHATLVPCDRIALCMRRRIFTMKTPGTVRDVLIFEMTWMTYALRIACHFSFSKWWTWWAT